MKYKNLSKTKFFENYKKAINGELVLVSQPVQTKERVFPCSSCGKIILEYKEGKYIVDEGLMANLSKEKRIRCICGKVNIFK